MSIPNPTIFTSFRIKGVDRSQNLLRAETWRTLNSVGSWMAVLRNPNGVYNGVFDVQDSFVVSANSVFNVLMQGMVDGPAVKSSGKDGESYWDQYVTLRGYDQGQDLLFHNDFDYDYPSTTQQLKAVLNDVFNVQLAASTNILYTPPLGATPVIGSCEFRKGSSFLSTIQQVMSRAGYLFYVDDSYTIQSGAPGFSASGVVIRSILNDLTNNLIDGADIDERDGDKHYNYVELYGKNPLFDAWTEFNASDWSSTPPNTSTLTNDTDHMVGSYSIKAVPDGVWIPSLLLDFSSGKFNYTSLDLTKGEIGIWAKYLDAAGGEASAGVYFWLRDTAGNAANYYSSGAFSSLNTTKLYLGEWGWCKADLGSSSNSTATALDQWYYPAGSFDWEHVDMIQFSYQSDSGVTIPDALLIDGITLPVMIKGIAQNLPAQAAYRRRPYVDSWTHMRTQNAIQEAANQLITQTQSTSIGKIKLTIPGNAALRYAGQSVTIDIPTMGLSNDIFYLTSIHHVVEPYADVSGGYGFDWITEIEAVPIAGATYDMSRLRKGMLYSPTLMTERNGVGLNYK